MNPTVLIFVRYYLPGHKSGGPVRTIVNMVDHLSEWFDFNVVTSDRDLSDDEPYAGVTTGQWSLVGKAQVLYLTRRERLLWSVARIQRQTPHGVLYLNSFFDLSATLYPLLSCRLGLAPKRPTVIAPRGEFSRGAYSLKAWKKRPYVLLTRMMGLYRDLVWQASSEREVADIRRVMGATAGRIVVAPDLAPRQFGRLVSVRDLRPNDAVRVVFLSRIARAKNLKFAVRAMMHTTVPVEFSVYGVIEDRRYWEECTKLAASLPPQVSFAYKGDVTHESVQGVLEEQDIFFLPTLGENYGHAIREALQAGLPVLISDQTPWRNLEKLGIGWDLPLGDPCCFAAVIDSQAGLSLDDRNAARGRATDYAMRVAQDESSIALNIALFRECMSGLTD